MTQMDRHDGHLSRLADNGTGVPTSRFFEAPKNLGPAAGLPDHSQQDSPAAPRGSSSCKVEEDLEDDSLPVELLPGSSDKAETERNGDVVAVSSKAQPGKNLSLEGLEGDLSDQSIKQRFVDCVREVKSLSRDIVALSGKLEDSEDAQRNRLQSISERIFEAERHLAKTEERQDDAIEKASATFQKQSANLMHVINQVNSNFEHLSSQIAQQGTTMSSLERTVARLQAAPTPESISHQLSQLSHSASTLEHRVGQLEAHLAETRRTAESLAHQVNSNELSIQQHKEVIEQDVPEQRREINDLHLRLEALRSNMAPRSQMMEVDSNYRSLQEKLEELLKSVQNVEARQDTCQEQTARANDEIASLLKMQSNHSQHINGSHPYSSPSISATVPTSSVQPSMPSIANIENGQGRRSILNGIGPPGDDDSHTGPARGMVPGDSVGGSASNPGGGRPSAVVMEHEEGPQLAPRTSWLSAFSSLPPPDHDQTDAVRRSAPSAPRGPTAKLAVRQSGDDSLWASASPGDRSDNNSMYEELFQDYIPTAPWEVSAREEEQTAAASLRDVMRVRQPAVVLPHQQRLHGGAMNSNGVGIARHH